MKKVSIILIAMGMASFCFAQNSSTNFDLSKFKDYSTEYSNHEYLNEVQNSLTPNHVRYLENIVSNWDVTKTKEFHERIIEEFEVAFTSDYGHIVVFYNGQGKIIRTIERFNNFALPISTSRAIAKKYPKWVIVKNRYSIKYAKGDRPIKSLMVKIIKDNERKWLKIDSPNSIL